MIAYCIQVLFVQLLFLFFYDVLLRKEPYFLLNRMYLLVTPIIALIIPLLKFSIIPQVFPQLGTYTLPEILLQGGIAETSSIVFPWELTLAAIWGLGMLYFAYRFFRKIQKLWVLQQKGASSQKHGIIQITLPKTNVAFTFLNRIFIGEELSASQKAYILQHERVHVYEKHTWDLLWFEGLRVLLWFNPLWYLFQKRIATLQEYIADAQVVKQMDKTHYYEGLLNQLFQTENISFINTFFTESLIKKRIHMLQKSKSLKRIALKYVFLFPLMLCGMLVAVSCANGEGNNAKKEQNSNLVSSNNEEPKELFFTEIDKVPTFPGCEDKEGEDAEKCFTQKIASFVVKEFNKDVASEGISGRERIIVDFTIDAEGKIRNVKAKADYAELELEAVRVASQLPQMIPGEHKGKKTAVKFTLPILFELE